MKQIQKKQWCIKVRSLINFLFSDDNDGNKFTLGDAAFFAWCKQKNRLEHTYAVTSWALSPSNLRYHSWLHETIKYWQQLSQEVGGWNSCKTSLAPCSNKKGEQNCWWNYKLLVFFGKNSNISPAEQVHDNLFGQSCSWHEIDYLPFSEVLSFVVCCTTSKLLKIGSVERSWRDIKTIKNRKRANVAGEYLEKRAVLYMFANIQEAEMLSNIDSSQDPNLNVFGDLHTFL